MKENNREIVDCHGNVLKKETNKKNFFLKNGKKILLLASPAGIAIFQIIDLFVSKKFAVECANYYGVDQRYFIRTGIFADKIIVIVGMILVFISPVILAYLNKGIYSKAYTALTFLVIVMFLFAQDIMYMSIIIEKIPFKCLAGFMGLQVCIFLFLIMDILNAYFLIENGLKKHKKCRKIKATVCSIAFFVHILMVIVGAAWKLNDRIEDKKEYEVIEGNRAVIAEYEDKLVVMNCEVQGESLILQKGCYCLEQMTGVPITYRKYDKVICEDQESYSENQE